MTNSLNPIQSNIENKRSTLVKDLKGVVADANEMLKDVSDAAVEGFQATSAKIDDKLENAKARLDEARQSVMDKTSQAAAATNGYVSANPWKAVGLAAGAGLILGYLIRRRA